MLLSRGGPSESIRSANGSCAGPDKGGSAYTVAGREGAVIAGLTVRPGASGREGQVSVQLVGPGGPVAAERLRLRLADGPEVALEPSGTGGCYGAQASVGGATRASVVGVINSRIRIVSLRLPRRPRPASELVARAVRATAALGSVRETVRVLPAPDRPAVTVRASYAGRLVVSQTSGEGTTRLVEPGWQRDFLWMVPGGLRLPTQVGWVRRGGHRLAVVTGYVPAPIWLELLVDPATGRVFSQRMLAPGHVMSSSFSGWASRKAGG